MTKPAIRVDNLSKRYRLGTRTGDTYHTLRESLALASRQLMNRLRGQRMPTRNSGDFWALKDVSFEVQPGEVVGIIGRNGAGKSTLLKILSRIVEPTSGRAEIHGRMGSLLEVGTGFHPELTGRENIFLNGAILGMKREEIANKFDEIVAFAEIEQFLDTPVKRYSSGMYVRLAFAVAAHLEPEILVIDEVLAVGDVQFQRKCLGKLQDVANEGRTVLFVSHNLPAVQGFCSRAVFLEKGSLICDGPVKEVLSRYVQLNVGERTARYWPDISLAPGGSTFRLRRARIRPADKSMKTITVRTPLVIEFEYWNLEPGAHLNLSLHVINSHGIIVFNTAPIREPNWHGKPFPVGLFRSECHVPGNLLNDGYYRIQLLAVRDQAHVIHNYHDIIEFDVADEREPSLKWHGKWQGAVRPDFDWTTHFVEPHSCNEQQKSADSPSTKIQGVCHDKAAH